MKEKPDIKKVNRVVPEGELIQEIGSGGFKIVYKARIGEKIEALKLAKIPHDEEDSNVREENRRRIFRELDILAKCKNPYLVKLGSIEPRPCKIDGNEYVLYSEEYVLGKSIRQLILAGEQPSSEQLVNLGVCMLKAIQELSALNVIHRDIKPDNIIRTDVDDRPYILLDLGLAFLVGGSRITRDSARIPGTLYYIAPEMLDQGFRQNLDYRADIYTIGLTLYEYASGINPYARRDDEPFTTLYRIKKQKPIPLGELRKDLPRPLCTLITQLMRKIPALRPANIEQLIEQLEEF